MSGGYSGKFLQRQCKIQLSRDNLGEQKVLKSAFCRFSKLKIQNFGNHGATSRIYWVYYKPLVLSYSKVGKYNTVGQSSIQHSTQSTEYYKADISKYISFSINISLNETSRSIYRIYFWILLILQLSCLDSEFQ